MNLSDLFCDLHDVKRQVKLHKFGSLPKDNEGTETTIDDCLDNIIEQLEEYNEDSLKWEIVNDYDKEFYEREFYDKPAKEGLTE